MEYDCRTTKECVQIHKHPTKYAASCILQSCLWYIGIAWHNTYADECTKDFNCCNKGIGRKAWLRI